VKRLSGLLEADRSFDSKSSQRISGTRHKTVTRTFRIKAEWDNILKHEAERQGISVNVLMNLILRRYALFDRWTHSYNAISLTQRAFREVIEGIPAENLALAGEKSGPSDVQNILDIIGLPSNYDSFAYLVSEHFGGSDFAMWFTCYRHIHENSDIFHLQHNLGRGWSLYLQKYLLSYLKTLKIDGEAKVYDHAVNLKVTRPR
jgi:hypothetical protein